MKLILITLFLFNAGFLFAQSIDKQNIHSANTNDDYEIIIRKPEGFSADKSYHIIYVADGSIKLGNYLLGTDKSWKQPYQKAA